MLAFREIPSHILYVLILSHRGYWKTPDQRNTLEAFEHSFSLGFGTETDVRDACGRLVISHDMPSGNEISLEDLLKIRRRFNQHLPLALNVKCDGMQAALQIQMAGAENYFLFDMSVPDSLVTSRSGLRYFSRQSELEPTPILLDRADGVWMDMFYGDWVTEDSIRVHLEHGRRVCLVSPELHKRSYDSFWRTVATWELVRSESLMLCTDFPEEARAFFRIQ